jgi:hypothetical protein
MSNVIGNHVDVAFAAFGDKTMKGKVDTGATICSLDAVDINVDEQRNVVSFRCPSLSDNVISMPIKEIQTVRTADGGARRRPVVATAITINGQTLKSAEFNLNDRTDMDDKLLIGQNVLQACNFVINVHENEIDPLPSDAAGVAVEDPQPDQNVITAVRTLIAAGVTLEQFAAVAHEIRQAGEGEPQNG